MVKRGLATITLCTLIVLLLAIPFAVAAVPTPGSVLQSTWEFFKGMFGGTANIADASFLVFILYFILFLAVFVEGLSRIPLFGERGHLSTPGKWFAFAAAALATIALFIVKGGKDILPNLVAPFGVWGGLVVAAVIAYITFRFIRDMDAFSDNIMIAMAIAASVGITFAGFMLNLETMLGWGFLIMILAFIVGALRGFAAHRQQAAPEREGRREQRQRRGREQAEAAQQQRQGRRGREQREDRTRHPTAFLVQAVEDCDNLLRALAQGNRAANRQRAVRQAQGELEELQEHVEHALRYLRAGRRRERGAQYEALDAVYRLCGAAVEAARDLEIPEANAAEWQNAVAALRNAIAGDKGIRASCGNMIQQLEQYVQANA